jgi:DNA-binding CsgD family transcriptional regulator
VGQYPLLRETAGRAAPGSGGWCDAQCWLGQAAVLSGDLAGALGHYTAVRDAIGDRGPARALVDCLCGRSVALSNLGRTAEAAEEGGRALAMAREAGYPAGEAQALKSLIIAAYVAGDLSGTVQLAWQAEQIPADIPGWIARNCTQWLIEMLTEAGDLAAAQNVCEAGLARSRDAGDLRNLAVLLMQMATLDLRAGRVGDAAAHLREALQITARAGDRLDLLDVLDCCAHLCAATRRRAEALTVWAAHAALIRHEGLMDDPLMRRRREPLSKARQALGPARTRAAEERGTALSLATAAEYALMLTSPAQQPAGIPDPGKLSARERQLVTLIAQGRTDAQIAAQLSISIHTVSSHLGRIRDKTGCRRRADLTRLALQAGLV